MTRLYHTGYRENLPSDSALPSPAHTKHDPLQSEAIAVRTNTGHKYTHFQAMPII